MLFLLSEIQLLTYFALKLQANSAVVCVVTLYFEHFTFYIPLEVLYYNRWYLKAVKNVLTSYFKLCYVYVKFKQTNQSSSPSKITNQSMLNGAPVMEMVNNSFSKARKALVVWESEERSN